jgi:hypothetical protein
MKNPILRAAILMAGLLPVTSTAFAQSQTSATYLSGTGASAYSMSLGNYYSFNLGYSHTYMGFNMRPGGNNWLFGTDMANNGGSMLLGNIAGTLSFITVPTANAANTQTLTDAQVYNDYRRMQITANGQVIIGKTQPTTQLDYKLAVEGKVVAQSMYVTNPSTWADYVFAPAYKVMPLPELEAYLHANKHLPYIPAAKEVEAKGYNVAEMDANLLRTVEELTLQLIALRKEVEQLKAAKATN